MDDLLAQLRGVPFRPDALRPVLEAAPLTELFGAITADEIIATIFDA